MRLKLILFLGFVCLTLRAADTPAVFSTNRTMRSLSLDECIRQALEHNFSIQIKRFDPNINRFQLEASRGIYDPVFTAQYTHFYNATEGRFNQNTGVAGNSSTAEADTFAPGVNGVLPTGLKYSLNGNFIHSRGASTRGSFDDYVTDASFQLEQPLLKDLWVNAGRTTIQINKRNLQISELAVEEQIRVVTRDVQLAYFEVLFALEDVKVQEKALELANKLASDNNEKVKAGKLAPLDAKQAEAQAATSLADLIQAQRRVLAAENILKNLITDDYQSWHKTGIEPAEKLIAVPERLDITESWTSALNNRPDWKQLGLEAEKLKLNRKFRWNHRLPELGLFGGYGRGGLDSSIPASTNLSLPGAPVTPAHPGNFGDSLDDISRGLSPRWNIGVGVRIPFSNKQERSLYRTSDEQVKQNEVQLNKLRQDILFEVDNSMDSARASYESVGATHQARLYAELALDGGRKRLEAGVITSFEVLVLLKDLTAARSAEARALANDNQNLTRLFYLDGTVLERNKISIKFK